METSDAQSEGTLRGRALGAIASDLFGCKREQVDALLSVLDELRTRGRSSEPPGLFRECLGSLLLSSGMLSPAELACALSLQKGCAATTLQTEALRAAELRDLDLDRAIEDLALVLPGNGRQAATIVYSDPEKLPTDSPSIQKICPRGQLREFILSAQLLKVFLEAAYEFSPEKESGGDESSQPRNLLEPMSLSFPPREEQAAELLRLSLCEGASGLVSRLLDALDRAARTRDTDLVAGLIRGVTALANQIRPPLVPLQIIHRVIVDRATQGVTREQLWQPTPRFVDELLEYSMRMHTKMRQQRETLPEILEELVTAHGSSTVVTYGYSSLSLDALREVSDKYGGLRVVRVRNIDDEIARLQVRRTEEFLCKIALLHKLRRSGLEYDECGLGELGDRLQGTTPTCLVMGAAASCAFGVFCERGSLQAIERVKELFPACLVVCVAGRYKYVRDTAAIRFIEGQCDYHELLRVREFDAFVVA